ncbi:MULTISPECIES: 30S ribosome-binding factor RbfA [Niveibacterium]|uniref:Ribosome-binding factor A n=1 Tax=Niveibacterium microcysteis TaxID=2811415 RepID=A0ABX7MBN5_9RHOO|nr:30S ribosome-binding factor RbfA [Niveibacterium microcysteis]QSI77875.1 30S ribosome-binding factor RbfA [Niveibacterium microcysteis]
MAKTFSRGDRVAEQIRRELAELIRMEVKDPRVGFVTLTSVEVSPDYSHAKVFFTTIEGERAVPELAQGLRRASGFLRRELGRRIRIHTIPDLHWVYDRSIERGAQLSALIDEAVRSDAAHSDDVDEAAASPDEAEKPDA